MMRQTILASVVALGAFAASPALALVTPNTTTPGAAVDSTNTRPYWVGLGIRNEAGNGGGTCTGLLINPRTVLFAAHCVDGLAPGAYDANLPGNRAQVGYTTDPTFGRTNLRNWLFGQDFVVPPGDGRTMVGSTFVWYDPRSRFGPQFDPNNGTFLPADVAIAGFDTPTEILGRDGMSGVGLLFSPVAGLVPVTIGGYGESGNGQTGVRTSGATEESFFRRLGQNMLGFLGDGRTVSLGVYGTASADILNPAARFYQDLYWMDFDDPLRATRPFFNGPGGDPLCVSTNLNCRLDHDVFPGDAVAGEAITGAGDSGSPLVTSAFGRDVSLGVLSSGNRFFYESLGNPNDNLVRFTAFSNYGTTAAYNPLFLFWDQIVINNPYKYVTTRAGDGEWTDASRWVQELDPLYFTLAGNTLVNGVPTTAALGSSGATPNVGTVRPSPSPAATCAFTGTCPPTGGTTDPDAVGDVDGNQAQPGWMSVEEGATRSTITRTADVSATREPITSEGYFTVGSQQTTMDGMGAQRVSSPTRDAVVAEPDQAQSTLPWTSGLMSLNSGALTGPGSTNFVANNVLGTAGVQNSTRWFEVNLRAAGTTFLTNSTITIDRLNVRGATAGLNIRSNGRLNTVMSSFVDAGMVTVDGILNSRALTVGGGMVGGTGTIITPAGLFVTGGVLSPGALGGGVGNLTVTGPATFSGAGMFGVDVASGTSVDRLTVNGALTLGGTLAVNAAFVPTFGTTWTVATGTSITGAFNNFATNMPGVLRPEAIVSGTNLQVRVTALPFTTFLGTQGTAEQRQVAAALDQVRSVAGTGTAANLFAGIDPMNVSALLAAFEGMKPSNALAVNQNVRLDNSVAATAIFDRLSRTRAADRGTMTVSVNGAAGLMPVTAASMNSVALASMVDAADGETTSAVSIAPEWSVFATVTYGYGSTDIQTGSNADPSSMALTVGADRRIDPQVIVGFGATYQTGDSDLSLVGNSVESTAWSVNGYAALDLTERTKLDTWIRAGSGTLDTLRTQTLGATTFNSAGTADTSSMSWGTTLSHDVPTATGITWTPMLTAIASKTDIDGYVESSGSTALRVDERTVSSLQIKAGLQAAGEWTTEGTRFRPYGRVSLVNELDDSPDTVTARFISGGAGALPITVTGAERTTTFGELGAGFSIQGSDRLTLSVEANQTVGRDELELGSVSVTGRLRF